MGEKSMVHSACGSIPVEGGACVSVNALKPGDIISRNRGGDYTFVRKSRIRGFITAICHEHNIEESWPVEHFRIKDTTHDR